MDRDAQHSADVPSADGHAAVGVSRLELLKTLGDNTRYAIYLELARSPRPLATAEIADTLDLHANTVRPHLERMRDLGLVEVSAAATGAVGRPQHRYALASDAPSLGLEPPAFPTLARMLLQAAHQAGLAPDDLERVGRDEGRLDRSSAGDADTVVALERRLDGLGFDPMSVCEGEDVTVAFAHCPFQDLAENHPDLVCALHRGLVEGFVADDPTVSLVAFHPLVHREPCRMHLHAAGRV